MPEIPHHWEGGSSGDAWSVEIDHDKFAAAEPFVVALRVEGNETGTYYDALATPTPQQAREMATALNLYADYADDANTRGESDAAR